MAKHRIGKQLSGSELKKFRSALARLKKSGPARLRKTLAKVDVRRARPMQVRGGKHLYEIVSANRGPVSLQEFDSLTKPEQEAEIRAAQAMSKLLRGVPLKKALKEAGTTRANLKKYAGALEFKNGKLVNATSDSLVRVMPVYTTEGLENVRVQGHAEASLIGRFMSAVGHFAEKNDAKVLTEFEGKTIGTGDEQVTLLTDPSLLKSMLKTHPAPRDLYPKVG